MLLANPRQSIAEHRSGRCQITDQNIRILTSGHASGTLPWMKTTPQNWKEARRLQAWHLKQQGWPQRQIAEALGVSEAAVSQWMTRARDGGPHALRHRPPSGAPRRLAAAPLARLPDLWHRGSRGLWLPWPSVDAG